MIFFFRRKQKYVIIHIFKSKNEINYYCIHLNRHILHTLLLLYKTHEIRIILVKLFRQRKWERLQLCYS